MTAVRAILSRHLGLDLAFIEHRDSGTVHIVLPDDPDEKPGPVFRFSEIPEDVALGAALGDTPTLCGYRAVQNVGGVGCGDQLLETFDDQRLCARCHRALGPEHQSRAFEHPTSASSTDPVLDTVEEAARR